MQLHTSYKVKIAIIPPTALFNGGKASADWYKASTTRRKAASPILAETETAPRLRLRVVSLLATTS